MAGNAKAPTAEPSDARLNCLRVNPRVERAASEINKDPRPEAVVLGRSPRGGHFRVVAPVGGVDVKPTHAIPRRSATATPTGRLALPSVLWASSFGEAELNAGPRKKHAGSLEALRVTRPEAVVSARNDGFMAKLQVDASGRNPLTSTPPRFSGSSPLPSVASPWWSCPDAPVSGSFRRAFRDSGKWHLKQSSAWDRSAFHIAFGGGDIGGPRTSTLPCLWQ